MEAKHEAREFSVSSNTSFHKEEDDLFVNLAISCANRISKGNFAVNALLQR